MILSQKIKERTLREFSKKHTYPKKNIVDEIITSEPFKFSAEWKAMFLAAMKHGFEHHSTHSKFYKRLCQYKKFDKSCLKTFEDIWDIPFVLSDTFKFYNLDTKTPDLLRLTLTSSGTSGRKSKVYLDMTSGQRILYSTYHIYRSLGLVDEITPTNYLMMAYNPQADESVATTNSDVIISSFTPRKGMFYTLDLNKEGEMSFLKESAVDKLKAFISEGMPIRILGFLHHTCEVIKAYYDKYGKVDFPNDSYILSGGGWKNFANFYGPGFDLFNFLNEHTNIDLKNVRDLYTLSEHAVFYLECEHHNMHIPNVSLACIRDPRTLRRLPEGKAGLIHLYTPLVESSPVLSLLTTDYGYIEKSCTCQTGGPYLKITGRAGVTKKATCTLTAEQYIKSKDLKKGAR